MKEKYFKSILKTHVIRRASEQKVLIRRILFVITFFLLSIQAFSHGDLSVQIEKKTQEILKFPDNFKLYYERGLLYQQHIEYTKALEDYLKSESLGNLHKEVNYRMAEVYYVTDDYNEALKRVTSCLEIDRTDVKAKKLEAQILFNLKAYTKALDAYDFVMQNMVDFRPEDIIEYSNIILAEQPKNYDDALDAIEFGLQKLGPDTLSLQLKKLEYLKASNQIERVITQYDYFILEYNRKEFWYYKKAVYLSENNHPEDALISLKLATISIAQLDAKFKNMDSIIELKANLETLEKSLN